MANYIEIGSYMNMLSTDMIFSKHYVLMCFKFLKMNYRNIKVFDNGPSTFVLSCCLRFFPGNANLLLQVPFSTYVLAFLSCDVLVGSNLGLI